MLLLLEAIAASTESRVAQGEELLVLTILLLTEATIVFTLAVLWLGVARAAVGRLIGGEGLVAR